MVLVGDPKQSIYGSRVPRSSVISPPRRGQEQRNLIDNWRSDGPLDALGAILVDAELGDPRIAVRPVTARHPSPASSVRRRCACASSTAATSATSRPPSTACRRPSVCATVTDDVAADIATALASEATILVDDCDGPVRRRIEPGDIAVLLRANKTIEPFAAGACRIRHRVRRHRWAERLRHRRGAVLVVCARRWRSPPTHARSGLRRRRRRWASTARAGSRGDAAVGDLAAALAGWARVFDKHGPAAMTARLLADRRTAERVLALSDESGCSPTCCRWPR